MQQLSELINILQPLGLQHLVEQHVLYPGQRRTQLVQAMLSRCAGAVGGLLVAPNSSHVA